MSGKLTIPVPDSLTAWYLVPSAMSAGQARELAMGVVDKRTRWLIERKECGLKVDISTIVAPDGASPDCPALMSRFPRLVSFRVTCHSGIAAFHEWAGRALAAEFAAETKKIVIDGCTGQLMSVAEARASLHEKEDGNLRLSDWVRVMAGDDRALSLATAGLRRYGLPELRVAEAPGRLGDAWSVVLAGLGHRLRREFAEAVCSVTPGGELPYSTRAPDVFEIPAEMEVTAADVAGAYCLRGLAAAHGSVIGLSLGQDQAGTFLAVRPPDGWERGTPDFLVSVAEGPLNSVLRAAGLFDALVTGVVGLDEFAGTMMH
jgi:hypothetical protein